MSLVYLWKSSSWRLQSQLLCDFKTWFAYPLGLNLSSTMPSCHHNKTQTWSLNYCAPNTRVLRALTMSTTFGLTNEPWTQLAEIVDPWRTVQVTHRLHCYDHQPKDAARVRGSLWLACIMPYLFQFHTYFNLQMGFFLLTLALCAQHSCELFNIIKFISRHSLWCRYRVSHRSA